MQKFGPTMKNAGSIVQLEKWLNETEEFSSSFKAKVQDGFRVFLDLVLDKKLNKVFKKPAKISPIEFILISLLVAVHKDKFTKAQLSAAIGNMRDDVRDTHVDIRMNDRVTKTMLEFIRQLKPSKVPGDAGSIAGSSVGEKRKRADEEDTKVNVKKAQPPTPSSSTLPPKPQPTHPPSGPRHGMQNASSSSSAAPDRMAAIRAAKSLAAQNAAQGSNHPPPLPSPSIHALQSNYATSQLPSPGQSFSFNGNPYPVTTQVSPPIPQQHHQTLPQPPLPQHLPQRPSSHSILEASSMAQTARPNDNRSRLETSVPPPYDYGPSRNYDQDPNWDRRGSMDSRRSSYTRPTDAGWGSRQGR